MSGDFVGLSAIVTGGSSGIGRATAVELRARGATVAVLDLDPGGLPADIAGFAADVASRPSVDAAVSAAAATLGGIDVVVNNAGVGAIGTVADNTDDEWLRVLDVNVVGMARVVTAALPWLRRSGHASVVNTSSIAALNGLPGRALYAASKGAVLSLTLAMAADHVHEGIRVNCVCPGTAETPWIDRLLARAEDPVAERAALQARQPIGRLVSPEEAANAIAYLASPRSGSTTGTVLNVDGGVTHLRVGPAR
ncbi:SDR family oxidoreductase [Micromonospora sp. Llam7]|uniref:SDR family NAD(P)-dependent oxidoreductase n=1 Tax=Micromonospora tarapacensis TaxID=2835305 RepID=UPI001C83C407|nr:SDR family oxidoreductase [Micromonospora tarapacensis]MBX7266589.1 SDR family oxidoreductase [Micromonospora tarapacensis]